MKIYTRKGDDGRTGLFGGGRVSKASLRVEAYGDVDELNAAIGWAASQAADAQVKAALPGIQRDLFALGAQLADPAYEEEGAKQKTRITPDRVEEFERIMDDVELKCGALKAFILPAGTPGAAALHVARTVCRRAERRVVELAAAEPVPPIAVIYLNRLSDLLFMLARGENRATGDVEIPW